MIQRAPADYRHPEDGGGVDSRLNSRFNREIDRDEEETNPSDARRTAGEVDRSELRQKRGEVQGDTKPDVDRPAQEKPGVERSAATVEEEADSPPDPLVEGEEAGEPQAEEGAGEEAGGAAEQAAALADQAFAAADAQSEPAPEADVVPPEPVAAPVDASGESLEADPEADVAVASLADRAQFLREQGALLRAQAAEGRANAQIMRGNLAKVTGEISKADEGISTSKEHAQYRREVVGQAEQGLAVSEEKQQTVASGAPEYSSKADEGKEDSGPMSSEASSLSAENAANTPDDPEAAAKSREQGGKIDSAGQGAVTMDSAISQTKDRAGSLAQDAARAAQLNTETQGKISQGQSQLDQTDERLNQMETEAGQARAQVEGMAGQPDDLNARAEQLDAQGQALIASSFELEERLRSTQRSYEAGMQGVPGLEPWEPDEEELLAAGEEGGFGDEEGAFAGGEEESVGEEGLVQLLPDERSTDASAEAAPAAGATLGGEMAPAGEAAPVDEAVTEASAGEEVAPPGVREAREAADGAEGEQVSEEMQEGGLEPGAAEEAASREGGEETTEGAPAEGESSTGEEAAGGEAEAAT
jgi:hypothetical protein